jgi:hypothetical protein
MNYFDNRGKQFTPDPVEGISVIIIPILIFFVKLLLIGF